MHGSNERERWSKREKKRMYLMLANQEQKWIYAEIVCIFYFVCFFSSSFALLKNCSEKLWIAMFAIFLADLF